MTRKLLTDTMFEIIKTFLIKPVCSLSDFNEAVDYAKENIDMNYDGSISIYEMIRAICKYILLRKW